MGWAFRASNSVSGTGTFTLAVVTGDLIVHAGGGAATPTLSDNVNGTYTVGVNFSSDRPMSMRIACKIATTTATLTMSSGGAADSSGAACFSHTDGAIPGTINVSGTVISAATKAITTTVANTLLAGVSDASTSNNPGTGFTAFLQIANADRITAEYETDLTNSAGSNTVTFSQGTARGMIALAFDPPAASSVFIPIIGRGPGMALAGRGGLVGRSRYQANDAGLLIPAHLLAGRERSIHVSR